MDRLRIRAYNVLFGDAFLVTFPDQNPNGTVETSNILIDVGNLLSEGGSDQVFKPVLEDILNELTGRPLDLYISTHEHLDHTQGLLYAEKKLYSNSDNELSEKLNTRYTWLTASSEKDYYKKHPNAKKKHLEFTAIYQKIDRYMKALKSSGASIPLTYKSLWLNNNPRKTSDCVDYIRNLSTPDHTCYVHRQFEPNGHHPFEEANIEIWAPEEDTSSYYSKARTVPMSLGVTEPAIGSRKNPSLTDLVPPAGVYAGAFFKLVNMRKGHFENLLAIDEAANNTSIVFCLEWRGFRLLFPGDAEDHSWKIMNEKKVLKPIHFLKISHHGSQNGTPEPDLLDKLLPKDRPDSKPRKALLSTTKEQVYPNVPDTKTVDLVRRRCDILYEVQKADIGRYVDIEFEADDSSM